MCVCVCVCLDSFALWALRMGSKLRELLEKVRVPGLAKLTDKMSVWSLANFTYFLPHRLCYHLVQSG